MTVKTLTLPCSALLLALALSLGGESLARAQDGAPPAAAPRSAADSEADDVADSRATGFRAVTGAQVEDVPGGLMLVGAYGAIAVLLLLFLLRQQSQLGALSTRMQALRAEIERKRTEQDQL